MKYIIQEADLVVSTYLLLYKGHYTQPNLTYSVKEKKPWVEFSFVDVAACNHEFILLCSKMT